ncbi:MAG: tRNA dihydrouridine synthase DusB [Lachnospiraceae bacterium]|nr:tRNA dihydrouridine synthase DusB [Lachnospiraceae bacterium]
MKIGNVSLDNNIILAPMAGVTDLPFRLLCREQGAGLVCTEMVSAKAIYYHNKNTDVLLSVSPDERPVSLQLFGSDPDIISEMAAAIEDRPFDILDFNMGCPVPKVTKNGEGSALMREPKLVEEIITKTVRRIHKPMTVKIRKGFAEDEINAVEIARIAEASGAAAVAVHGRTREQYYSGKADWDIIRQVREAVKIPVIGNGDVDSPQAAKRMLDETGCDGIMVGRAARGNPWLFHQIREYLDTGTILPRPTQDEVREMMLRHARMQVEFKGEYIGIREMRAHISWYTAGFPNSSRLRAAVNQAETLAGLETLLSENFSDTCESVRRRPVPV